MPKEAKTCWTKAKMTMLFSRAGSWHVYPSYETRLDACQEEDTCTMAVVGYGPARVT